MGKYDLLLKERLISDILMLKIEVFRLNEEAERNRLKRIELNDFMKRQKEDKKKGDFDDIVDEAIIDPNI